MNLRQLKVDAKEISAIMNAIKELKDSSNVFEKVSNKFPYISSEIIKVLVEGVK